MPNLNHLSQVGPQEPILRQKWKCKLVRGGDPEGSWQLDRERRSESQKSKLPLGAAEVHPLPGELWELTPTQRRAQGHWWRLP